MAVRTRRVVRLTIYKGALLMVLLFLNCHFRGVDMSWGGEAEKPGKEPTVQQTVTERRKSLSKTHYEVIAEKNLFNPKRKEQWDRPATTKPANKKVAIKPVIKKPSTLVLEGVIIFGEYRAALIKDRVRAREGAKRVEVGDNFGNYTIESILEKEVVLTGKDGGREVLQLYSGDEPIKRSHIKTQVSVPPQKQPGQIQKKSTSSVKKRRPLKRR